MKNEIYTQNISHINNTHQEEIRKIKIEFENKLNKSEDEKNEIKRKNLQLEREISIKFCSNDIIDYQKKYLNEMKQLQKSFEDYKIKTNEEIKLLIKSKEDSINKLNFYKENSDKLNIEMENSENLYKDSFNAIQIKFNNCREMINNTENLKSQLESSKSEINFLKNKIAQMESEKQNNENISKRKLDLKLDDLVLSDDEERANQFTNKYSDIVNYQNSSNLQTHANFNEMDSFSPPNNLNKFNTSRIKYNNEFSDEDLYKVIDLKLAHKKIRDMDDCFNKMNEESERLKGKLGSVFKNIKNVKNSAPNFNKSKFEENDKISFRHNTDVDILTLGTINKDDNEQEHRNFSSNLSNGMKIKNNKNYNNECKYYISSQRKEIIIPTTTSNKESRKNTYTNHNINDYERDFYEIIDNNVLEFPLQKKINAKIKK